MSFRRRITLASAAAVAIAVVLASGLVYVLTSNQLHGQVDTQLRNRLDNLRLVEHAPRASARPAAAGHPPGQESLGASAAGRRIDPAGQRPGQRLAAAQPGPRLPAAGRLERQGPVQVGAANVTLPVDRQDPRPRRGQRQELLPRCDGQRHRPAHSRRVPRAGTRRAVRPAADRSERTAEPSAPDPGPDRPRRHRARRAARTAGGRRRGAAGQATDAGDRARGADAGPLSSASSPSARTRSDGWP